MNTLLALEVLSKDKKLLSDFFDVVDVGESITIEYPYNSDGSRPYEKYQIKSPFFQVALNRLKEEDCCLLLDKLYSRGLLLDKLRNRDESNHSMFEYIVLNGNLNIINKYIDLYKKIPSKDYNNRLSGADNRIFSCLVTSATKMDVATADSAFDVVYNFINSEHILFLTNAMSKNIRYDTFEQLVKEKGISGVYSKNIFPISKSNGYSTDFENSIVMNILASRGDEKSIIHPSRKRMLNKLCNIDKTYETIVLSKIIERKEDLGNFFEKVIADEFKIKFNLSENKTNQENTRRLCVAISKLEIGDIKKVLSYLELKDSGRNQDFYFNPIMDGLVESIAQEKKIDMVDNTGRPTTVTQYWISENFNESIDKIAELFLLVDRNKREEYIYKTVGVLISHIVSILGSNMRYAPNSDVQSYKDNIHKVCRLIDLNKVKNENKLLDLLGDSIKKYINFNVSNIEVSKKMMVVVTDIVNEISSSYCLDDSKKSRLYDMILKDLDEENGSFLIKLILDFDKPDIGKIKPKNLKV